MSRAEGRKESGTTESFEIFPPMGVLGHAEPRTEDGGRGEGSNQAGSQHAKRGDPSVQLHRYPPPLKGRLIHRSHPRAILTEAHTHPVATPGHER
jgi:hypothetical protein